MLRRQGSPYEEYSDILLPRGGLRGHVQPSLLHSPQAAVLMTKIRARRHGGFYFCVASCHVKSRYAAKVDAVYGLVYSL